MVLDWDGTRGNAIIEHARDSHALLLSDTGASSLWAKQGWSRLKIGSEEKQSQHSRRTEGLDLSKFPSFPPATTTNHDPRPGRPSTTTARRGTAVPGSLGRSTRSGHIFSPWLQVGPLAPAHSLGELLARAIGAEGAQDDFNDGVITAITADDEYPAPNNPYQPPIHFPASPPPSAPRTPCAPTPSTPPAISVSSPGRPTVAPPAPPSRPLPPSSGPSIHN
ncbi:hypothetical protein FIBSPDRAFT_895201 [Athelia psychrophila]|uniref:Uncharacterized protein n=1 Tax=Athelia psychrophila TaxID=1759441 RepID=A0A166EVH7_9AGAM|nr:hypothetical protein FIBSPDRAFT_895201 [Fibularhizoctonia sp. CBS 109695]